MGPSFMGLKKFLGLLLAQICMDLAKRCATGWRPWKDGSLFGSCYSVELLTCSTI
ncbi:hypothetical protein BFJ66_g17919 [Fusarium oxysporum f. sp. cepae]|nr:hypothetical protein BFJ66_g17919 [Fusarium oxysporum f. sp. cepae]